MVFPKLHPHAPPPSCPHDTEDRLGYPSCWSQVVAVSSLSIKPMVGGCRSPGRWSLFQPACPAAPGSELGFSLPSGQGLFDFHFPGTSQTPVNIAWFQPQNPISLWLPLSSQLCVSVPDLNYRTVYLNFNLDKLHQCCMFGVEMCERANFQGCLDSLGRRQRLQAFGTTLSSPSDDSTI